MGTIQCVILFFFDEFSSTLFASCNSKQRNFVGLIIANNSATQIVVITAADYNNIHKLINTKMRAHQRRNTCQIQTVTEFMFRRIMLRLKYWRYGQHLSVR